MARRTSPLEQKWITRIILKDLRLGIAHERVLKELHSEALHLYNQCSDLKEVLNTLGQLREGNHQGECVGSMSLSTSGRYVNMFKAMRPMLAERVRIDDVQKVFSSHKMVLMEDKYDGERIVCHVDKTTDRLELYTRRGNLYTAMYGRQMKDLILPNIIGSCVILDGEMMSWDAALQRFIAFGSNRQVAARAQASGTHLCYVVFDVVYYKTALGEAYDMTQTPLTDRKYLLSRIVKQVPHRLELAEYKETKTVDDVRECLERIQRRREEGLILKDSDSLYKPNARRGGGWYKLKPTHGSLCDTMDLLAVGGFFGDGLRRRDNRSADDVDHISNFLLAVTDYNTTQPCSEAASHTNLSAVTVAKVGTGYTYADLCDIRDRLRPHCFRFSGAESTPWLRLKNLRGFEKPDIVWPLEHSFVMEVAGAEFVRSSAYSFKWTLRFPRAVRAIRDELTWKDAWRLSTLQEFRDASLHRNLSQQSRTMKPSLADQDEVSEEERRNQSDTEPDTDDEQPRSTITSDKGNADRQSENESGTTKTAMTEQREKGEEQREERAKDVQREERGKDENERTPPSVRQTRQRRRHRNQEDDVEEVNTNKVRKLLEGFRPTDLTDVQISSNLFKDCEVWVMSGDADVSGLEGKAAVEKSVVQNGGTLTQAFRRCRTTYVAAMRPSFRTSKVVQMYNTPVLHYSWILDSVDAAKLLPLTPRFVVSSTPDVRDNLMLNYDRFTDGFYTPLSTPDDLRAVFKCCERQPAGTGTTDDRRDTTDTRQEVKTMLRSGRFVTSYCTFRGIIVYVSETHSISQLEFSLTAEAASSGGSCRSSQKAESLTASASSIPLQGCPLSSYISFNQTEGVEDDVDIQGSTITADTAVGAAGTCGLLICEQLRQSQPLIQQSLLLRFQMHGGRISKSLTGEETHLLVRGSEVLQRLEEDNPTEAQVAYKQIAETGKLMALCRGTGGVVDEEEGRQQRGGGVMKCINKRWIRDRLEK
eukprot:GHVQ01011527.1.p1 GENE.GHVQ01011527.1~~GHVQ01011527.1.p1  ORF type:complete len:986 (-),score=186.32 GHVQ01011527.1:107-3064(-)